jgi:hypothetical protein
MNKKFKLKQSLSAQQLEQISAGSSAFDELTKDNKRSDEELEKLLEGVGGDLQKLIGTDKLEAMRYALKKLAQSGGSFA